MIANPSHRCIVLCGALAAVIACHNAGNRSAGVDVRHPSIAGIADIASLDVAADGQRIHALLAGRRIGRDGSSIVYLVSEDGGSSWSAPTELSQRGEPPTVAGHGNDVQIAVRGRHLVAVWQVEGDLPGTGPMVVTYSRDAGATWHRGANPAVGDVSNNQSYMDLAADHAGQFHLVWLDDRDEDGNSQGLRHARTADQGQTWRTEKTLDDSACTCCWNRVAAIPGGAGVVVLYRDHDPHDMRLSRSQDGGDSWQPMAAVGDFGWHFSGCPHCGGALTVVTADDRTTLHSIIWTGQPDAAGLYFLRSADLGETWSPPLAIGNARSRRADLAATGSELVAVFADSTTPTGAVSVRRSTDGGDTWSQPVPLTTQAVASAQPRVLATAAGFQAFWTEQDTTGRNVFTTATLH